MAQYKCMWKNRESFDPKAGRCYCRNAHATAFTTWMAIGIEDTKKASRHSKKEKKKKQNERKIRRFRTKEKDKYFFLLIYLYFFPFWPDSISFLFQFFFFLCGFRRDWHSRIESQFLIYDDQHHAHRLRTRQGESKTLRRWFLVFTTRKKNVTII